MLLLEGCNVNDATVQVLAQNCMLLREVSIKGSLGCSDKSAEVLLQVVPLLLVLNFIFRSRLTYAGVFALLLPPFLEMRLTAPLFCDACSRAARYYSNWTCVGAVSL